MGSFDFKSDRIYGRIPLRSGGTRVSLSATGDVSAQLTPGWYEMFAITTKGTGHYCWVKDGDSSVTAATTDFYIPADCSYIFEVKGGVNDYVAAISRGGLQGSLCIYKKYHAADRS